MIGTRGRNLGVELGNEKEMGGFRGRWKNGEGKGKGNFVEVGDKHIISLGRWKQKLKRRGGGLIKRGR